MQTTKDLLVLIDTGRDVRRENVKTIIKYVNSEQLHEIISLAKLILPKGTPKQVAKVLLLVGLATGYLSWECAEMYCESIHNSWVRWNVVELGL